ncbi:MAG: DUF362 domain-containing protein [Candidatus Zixiibacteriota bacterium]|nr:MAG: DUF362 domain-containing protein [candidate division Zixibacteria bacterium]
MEAFVDRGQTVLLKPDLMWDYPGGTGPVSDLEFVAAVGRLAARRGARVLVGDSPFVLRDTIEDFWYQTGVAGVARREGFELVNFEKAGSTAMPVETAVYYISRAVKAADVVINIPRLKADLWTGFAGGLRNVLGVLPGFQKGRLYKRGFSPRSLARTLVDVFSLVRPHLTILEAPAENGLSRAGGDSPGFILASRDTVALDTVVSVVLGFDLNKMHAIRYAADAGLGIGWPEGIVVAGEKLEKVTRAIRRSVTRRTLGFVPGMALHLVEPMLWMRSVVNEDICDGCGACIEFCPTKALRVRDGSRIPSIDYTLCINCWAGLSNCPARAINLRQSRFTRRVFAV